MERVNCIADEYNDKISDSYDPFALSPSQCKKGKQNQTSATKKSPPTVWKDRLRKVSGKRYNIPTSTDTGSLNLARYPAKTPKKSPRAKIVSTKCKSASAKKGSTQRKRRLSGFSKQQDPVDIRNYLSKPSVAKSLFVQAVTDGVNALSNQYKNSQTVISPLSKITDYSSGSVIATSPVQTTTSHCGDLNRPEAVYNNKKNQKSTSTPTQLTRTSANMSQEAEINTGTSPTNGDPSNVQHPEGSRDSQTPNPPLKQIPQGAGAKTEKEIQDLICEITKLDNEISKLPKDSIEKLVKEMRLDAKKDSLRMLSCLTENWSVTNNLVKDVNTLKSQQAQDSQKIEVLQRTQGEEKEANRKTELALEEVCAKVSILEGILSKHSTQIGNLHHYRESNDTRSMSDNLVISGIDEVDDENRRNLIEIITDFFSQTMLITKKIEIVSAKCIGNGQPRAVQLTLKNGRDKGVIFKHSRNLKDARNKDDNPYSVKDQLPLGIQESKRKQRTFYKINSGVPADDQLNATWVKGSLRVENRDYEDPVSPPRQ